jgi:hypothetical protein
MNRKPDLESIFSDENKDFISKRYNEGEKIINQEYFIKKTAAEVMGILQLSFDCSMTGSKNEDSLNIYSNINKESTTSQEFSSDMHDLSSAATTSFYVSESCASVEKRQNPSKSIILQNKTMSIDSFDTASTSSKTVQKEKTESVILGENNVNLSMWLYVGNGFSKIYDTFKYGYDKTFSVFEFTDHQKSISFSLNNEVNDIEIKMAESPFLGTKRINVANITYFNGFYDQGFTLQWNLEIKCGGEGNDKTYCRKNLFLYADLNNRVGIMTKNHDFYSGFATKNNITENKNVVEIGSEFNYEQDQLIFKKISSSVAKLMQFGYSLSIRNIYLFDLFYNSELISVDGLVKEFSKSKCAETIYELLNIFKSKDVDQDLNILEHDIIDSDYYDHFYKNEYNYCRKFNRDSFQKQSHFFWENYLCNVYEINEIKEINMDSLKWHPSHIIKKTHYNKLGNIETYYAALRVFSSVSEFKEIVFDHLKLHKDGHNTIKRLVKNSVSPEDINIIDPIIIKVTKNIICWALNTKNNGKHEHFECMFLNGTIVKYVILYVEKVILNLKKRCFSDDNLEMGFINNSEKTKAVIELSYKTILKYYQFLMRCFINKINTGSKMQSEALHICSNTITIKDTINVTFEVCRDLQRLILIKYNIIFSVFCNNYTEDESFHRFANFVEDL